MVLYNNMQMFDNFNKKQILAEVGFYMSAKSFWNDIETLTTVVRGLVICLLNGAFNT